MLQVGPQVYEGLSMPMQVYWQFLSLARDTGEPDLHRSMTGCCGRAASIAGAPTSRYAIRR